MKAKDHIKVGSAAFHPGRFVYTRRLLSEPRWVLGFIWALQKLEESDRRAQHTMDQLQREQRYLRRRLEQLGVERTRTDSTGSNLSSEKSDSDQGGLSERMRGGRGGGWTLRSACSHRDICCIWQQRRTCWWGDGGHVPRTNTGV